MTRKRVGQPLIDAFSETCEHCKGRGVIIHLEPAKHVGMGGSDSAKQQPADEGKRSGEGKRRRKDKSDKDKSDKDKSDKDKSDKDHADKDHADKVDKDKSDKARAESADVQVEAGAAAPEQPGGNGSGPAAVEAADGPAAPDTGSAEAPARRKRAGTRRRKAAEAEPVTADS
jgi:ribonuclease E